MNFTARIRPSSQLGSPGCGKMASVILFISLSVLACLCLIALLRERRVSERGGKLTIPELFPVHHNEFEKVDRRLADYEKTLANIHLEQRGLALRYLAELRMDFDKVTRLLNCAAKFVPEITLEKESERLWIAIRFRFEYWLAHVRIRLGFTPTANVRSLTAKVRFLAALADEFLSDVARAQGLRVLESDLNR